MQNPFWTMRLLGLGVPFKTMDIDRVLRGIETFSGQAMRSLRYALPNERKSRVLRGPGSVNASLPNWAGCLNLTARMSDGAHFAVDIWRLERARGVSSSVSGYQCHQLMFDFPRSPTLDSMTVTEALAVAAEVTEAFDATFGVVCPQGGGGLRQLYRERGLAEGIPGLFPLTLMGGAFRAVLKDVVLASSATGCVVHGGAAILGMALIEDWLDELPESRVEEMKAAIGHQNFAGERRVEHEQTGGFGLIEILREGMRMIRADRGARDRSSAHRFELDWSGLFIGT